MPTYPFYSHLPDGSDSMFVAYELVDDTHALNHARSLLAEHGSVVEVVVWRDDQIVEHVANDLRQLAAGMAATKGGRDASAHA